MANVTDNPVALAAAEMFAQTVDTLKPQKGLSMQLPELSGVTVASESAANMVQNANKDNGISR